MKTGPECLPCMIRLVLETARKVGRDAWLHKKVLLSAMESLPGADLDRPPAEVLSDTIGATLNVLGDVTAFDELKARSTEQARAIESRLREWIAKSSDPLGAAVRAATLANAFDALLLGTLDPVALLDRVADFAPALDEYPAMAEALEKARNVVYLLDNAGEAVVDRILLEQIAPGRDVVAVARRSPFWNDVGEADLAALGVDRLCAVANPGTDVMGAPVNLYSTEFRKRLDAADLVISKGPANFECLEETSIPAAFLFMVKCPRVAEYLKLSVGDGVVLMNRKKTGTRIMREGKGTHRAAAGEN